MIRSNVTKRIMMLQYAIVNVIAVDHITKISQSERMSECLAEQQIIAIISHSKRNNDSQILLLAYTHRAGRFNFIIMPFS